MKALIPILLLVAYVSSLGSGCKKAESDTVDSTGSADTLAVTVPRLAKLYKDTLVGNWTWSRTYQFFGPPNVDTFYRLPDTTFPITAVDDTTLTIFGFNIYYDENPYRDLPKPDTAKEILYWNRYTTWHKFYMKLYRDNDSLHFYTLREAGITKYYQYHYRTKLHH